jgi:hypothetical protein
MALGNLVPATLTPGVQVMPDETLRYPAPGDTAQAARTR